MSDLNRNNSSTRGPCAQTACRNRIFARKTSATTLKPVKTIRFSDRTCNRYLSEIRFCDLQGRIDCGVFKCAARESGPMHCNRFFRGERHLIYAGAKSIHKIGQGGTLQEFSKEEPIPVVRQPRCGNQCRQEIGWREPERVLSDIG